MIVCSCGVLTKKFIEEAIGDNAQDVLAAPSAGEATRRVLNQIHPPGERNWCKRCAKSIRACVEDARAQHCTAKQPALVKA